MYGQLDHIACSETFLAEPLMARFSASMAAFAKKFIFVTGGQSPTEYKDLNSTNMYDI